jgi:peptidyl-prolyl cis-trans isomerase A (cyclophilin A)
VKTLSPAAALAAICLAALSLPAAQAEDLTPPIVAKSIGDITVAVGAHPSVINLKNTFALRGVTQEVARFTTTLGIIDVELYPAAAPKTAFTPKIVATPKTVANFLYYVNRGEGMDGGYNYTVIEELIPGFFLQGGGYYVNSDGLQTLIPRAPVKSEPGNSNTTGTIAVALSAGPESGTSAWFFNLADNNGTVTGNPDLDDTSDGGPFTVFGRVIENGMNTINAIAALQVFDLSDSLGAAFSSVPLIDYNADVGATPENLVYTESIALIPLTAPVAGADSLLKIKVLDNTRPKLVEATISGRRLTLTYPLKRTGTAKITLQARDSAKTVVTTSFTVTVR